MVDNMVDAPVLLTLLFPFLVFVRFHISCFRIFKYFVHEKYNDKVQIRWILGWNIYQITICILTIRSEHNFHFAYMYGTFLSANEILKFEFSCNAHYDIFARDFCKYSNTFTYHDVNFISKRRYYILIFYHIRTIMLCNNYLSSLW